MGLKFNKKAGEAFELTSGNESLLIKLLGSGKKGVTLDIRGKEEIIDYNQIYRIELNQVEVEIRPYMRDHLFGRQPSFEVTAPKQKVSIRYSGI